MITLVFVMMAVLIIVDIVYYNRISEAVNGGRISITVETAYIAIAYNVVTAHAVLVAISAVLLGTLPLYSKLLRKINTSIDVEDNGELEAIDISGEE